jgi:predicted DCC family thiol-disulfide oxidoreductase YuxK
MVSLISEITDEKGRHALCGWVFFDRDCNVCTSFTRRFRRPLEKRGFGLAALQDPRVQAVLALPPEELLREMRVVTAGGEMFGGAEAIIFLAGQIWWAWPLYAAAKLPGAQRFLGAFYLWFADHRACLSGSCSLPNGGNRNGVLQPARGKRQ